MADRDPALVGVWRLLPRLEDGLEVHSAMSHQVFAADGRCWEVTPSYVPIRGQTAVASEWTTPSPDALRIHSRWLEPDGTESSDYTSDLGYTVTGDRLETREPGRTQEFVRETDEAALAEAMKFREPRDPVARTVPPLGELLWDFNLHWWSATRMILRHECELVIHLPDDAGDDELAAAADAIRTAMDLHREHAQVVAEQVMELHEDWADQDGRAPEPTIARVAGKLKLVAVAWKDGAIGLEFATGDLFGGQHVHADVSADGSIEARLGG